jgi:hypothetical protein
MGTKKTKRKVKNTVREVRFGTPVALPADEYARAYGLMGNVFWYVSHPVWEEDGLTHTSDVCRRLTLEAFDKLGIVEE